MEALLLQDTLRYTYFGLQVFTRGRERSNFAALSVSYDIFFPRYLISVIHKRQAHYRYNLSSNKTYHDAAVRFVIILRVVTLSESLLFCCSLDRPRYLVFEQWLKYFDALRCIILRVVLVILLFHENFPCHLFLWV